MDRPCVAESPPDLELLAERTIGGYLDRNGEPLYHKEFYFMEDGRFCYIVKSEDGGFEARVPGIKSFKLSDTQKNCYESAPLKMDDSEAFAKSLVRIQSPGLLARFVLDASENLYVPLRGRKDLGWDWQGLKKV